MSTKCEKITTKKYTERNGPPYKANAPGCRGKRKKGNDGLLYKSVRAKNGVYKWLKVVKAAKKVPKKSRKTRKASHMKDPNHCGSGSRSGYKCISYAKSPPYTCSRWRKNTKCSKKRKHSKKITKKTPKKSRKMTITQLRSQCKRSGKVYDPKTKRCRKSKRRVKKSSKKSTKKSKSPKKSSKKKMTIKEKKAYCKKNKLVYNPKTKRCNKPKTGVDYKIAKLMKAGFSRKQAVAIALNMKSKGKLGPKGGYYKKLKK